MRKKNGPKFSGAAATERASEAAAAAPAVSPRWTTREEGESRGRARFGRRQHGYGCGQGTSS